MFIFISLSLLKNEYFKLTWVVWCFQNGARSIHTAARYGHVGIINTLLQKGEKVDVTTSVSKQSNTIRGALLNRVPHWFLHKENLILVMFVKKNYVWLRIALLNIILNVGSLVINTVYFIYENNNKLFLHQ